MKPVNRFLFILLMLPVFSTAQMDIDWCQSGTLHSSGSVCCGACDGQCGGPGCGALPGGGSECCYGSITGSNTVCESVLDVGCVIPQNLDWCHTGTLHSAGEVCCGACDGQCGGPGCGGLPGGGSECCWGSITTANIPCANALDVGCIIPAPPTGSPTLPPTSTPTVSPTAPPTIPGVTSDPDCTLGILTDGVCCAASCGTCGGNGCNERPGGGASCCTGTIRDSGVECIDAPPPCNVVTQPVDPFCVDGIPSGNSCCASSCGTCGGTGCSGLPGGGESCCTSSILQADVTCERYAPPCTTNSSHGITFDEWPLSSHPWDELMTVVDACGPDLSPCAEVRYESYDRGSRRVGGTSDVPTGTEYTLSYDVMFESDFKFVRGGKLHGIGPSGPITGCKDMTDDGWSARVMWRDDGRLINYVYHQDKTANCGDNYWSDAYFTPGVWEAVSLYVRVNSAGNIADGLVRLYLNGQFISEAPNLRLRASDNAGLISKMMISTFHGGSDPSWAPNSTEFAYFDNFDMTAGLSVRSSPLS